MLALTLLLAVAVIAICALIGWRWWLSFNLEVHKRTDSLEVFDHTATVARSFLRSLWPRRPDRWQLPEPDNRRGTAADPEPPSD